jgi:hypothetical protein
MKKQSWTVLAVALFTLAASGNLLLAQMITVAVPFEFKVGDRTMPAGSYDFRRSKDDTTLTIRSLDTGEESIVAFITRLSPREDRKGSLAFDETNNTHYLSEVYMPGIDGFHLQGAPGEHHHSMLEAKK